MLEHIRDFQWDYVVYHQPMLLADAKRYASVVSICGVHPSASFHQYAAQAAAALQHAACVPKPVNTVLLNAMTLVLCVVVAALTALVIMKVGSRPHRRVPTFNT